MTDYGEVRLKLRQYKRPFYKLFRFVILVYIYVFLVDSPVLKSAATVAISIVVGLTINWLSTASGIIQGIIAGI